MAWEQISLERVVSTIRENWQLIAGNILTLTLGGVDNQGVYVCVAILAVDFTLVGRYSVSTIPSAPSYNETMPHL
jgi:hypothetical protein